MRPRFIAGWLIVLPTAGFAQTVTPADLQDHVVEARVTMDQQIRREGREFPVRLDQRLRVKFLRDNAIEFQMSSTSHGPRGAKDGPAFKGRVVLGKVNDARNMDGGQSVWFFDEGALTSLRTYGNAGGYKRTITFSRDAKGLNCAVKASHVREEGVGRVATRSIVDSAPVTILSSKQSSSACKVSKAPGS